MFTGRGVRGLLFWLEDHAEGARSSEGLVRRFVEECRRTQTILPRTSVIERLCADALVAAERRIDAHIADRIDVPMRDKLAVLLNEDVDRVSRFVWLRQFEIGQNSADMNRLLDRLEFLQGFGLSADVLKDVPPHRVAGLRRQGERCFTDDLRDISSDRRLAILAACAIEWQAAIANAAVETHDRIVGKTWRDARARCDVRIADARVALQETPPIVRILRQHEPTSDKSTDLLEGLDQTRPNGVIIGSSLKCDGVWWNEVERDRVRDFMRVVAAIQERA